MLKLVDLRFCLALLLVHSSGPQVQAEGCPVLSFAAARVFCAGQNPICLAVADFNSDGKPDFAVANYGSSGTSVLLGKGDGTFQTAVNYNASVGPRALVAADLNRDGKPDLVVANGGAHPFYRDGGVSILLGNGDGTFGGAVNYGGGTQPVSVTVGDFDGDGIPDLAVANLGTYLGANDGSISVLLGKGDGTFQMAANYSGGTSPSWVTEGDFNGDGKLDLVVANQSSYNVSVLLGNGDGTFHTAVNYGVGTEPVTGPAFVGARDLNGDGKLDLVVANYRSYVGGNVAVLLGRGDGTFEDAVHYSAGTFPNSLAISDVNGDGKLDLVVAGGGGNTAGDIRVLFGNGNGTFQSAVRYIVGGEGSRFPAVDDFNGDSKLDVAVLSSCGVAVLLGKGDGTFQAGASYNAGLSPLSTAAADFNGDGKLDLTVANNLNNNVSVLLGNGDGTFGTATNFTVGSDPRSVAVGDFDGDGKPDIVAANRGSWNVSILLGKGDGTFRSAGHYATGLDSPNAVAVGDFNGDGKLDLVVANYGQSVFNRPGGVSVLLGKGDGTFKTAVRYGAGSDPISIAVGDVNGDGKPDVVVANQGASPNYTNSNVSVLLGNGDGTFKTAINYDTGTRSSGVAAGDFNGDGKADLVAVNYGPRAASDVSILLGNGDGTFRSAIHFGAGRGSESVAVGDFNGDGKLDLAAANAGGDISLLLGNGDGTFQAAVSFGVDWQPYLITVADLNGDGKPDLTIGNVSSEKVSVLLNTCGSAGPALSVKRSGATVTLSRPSPSTGFILESTTNLSSTNWQPAAETAANTNDHLEVSVPLNQIERYFRLRKP